MILDGKVAAASIKQDLLKGFYSLKKKATLAIIHFNDPASLSYLKGRCKIAEELGVKVEIFAIDDNHDETYLKELITNLNRYDEIDGIMIDRPMPKRFNEFDVLNSISPNKDVDGYTYKNLGLLMSSSECFYSCTPFAAIRLCDYYGIDLASKDVLIVGRSINVGKPLALMALSRNATVTICHSKTKDIKEKCKKADVIFLALGKAGFLTADDVNENTIVVDIGINFVDNHLVGDASNKIYDICTTYSPVPGGVGVMTNIVLMENLLKACQRKEK